MLKAYWANFSQSFQILSRTSHGLAELVRLALGEAGELLGQQHHLLLIHGDTVGIVQVLLHVREVVRNSLLALLTRDEVRDIVHRTGPIEGVHSDEVLETRRAQLLQPCLHALRFKLEHAHGIAAAV